jgi:phosphoribosyl 1,2-cyclic phosphate phosphodiesterase
MKIQLLGTSAAEGWPALFCNCSACARARKLGGKDLRSRASLLIDDVLKIELPPDTLHHVLQFGLDLSKLTHLFITHSHKDHFAVDELLYLGPDFAKRKDLQPLRVYGNSNIMKDVMKLAGEGLDANFHEVKPFERIKAGPYDVFPILANHGSDEHPLNYIVSRHGKHVLFACDTGLYADETWQQVSDLQVDVAIVECTGGPKRIDYKTHMGFPDLLEYKLKAEESGLTGNKTRWVLTHFSHFGGATHEELVELGKPHGIEIGYDGMQIEI